ncbi:MAG: replication-associated recombination protein A [Candidatus Omnitrophota bacterium]
MSNQELPLAVRLRPQTLDQFVGQSHILGEGKLLRRAIVSKRVYSLIFYGPPGVGKTTLGQIIAKERAAEFKYLNASFSNVAEVKKVLLESNKLLNKSGKKTLLFIDEIHRFNKTQQETLIPDTEIGSIIFIGATIYNPYYFLINSLLSRSIVAEFKALSKEDLIYILKRALADKERGLGSIGISAEDEAIEHIAVQSDGDARRALSALEIGVLTAPLDQAGKVVFGLESAREVIEKNIFYDKKDSYHYDTISAFIKSIRGSDADSALYWLAKMLAGGEDPRFIARRLVILASEDIGNARPFALVLATSCFQSVELIGMPEAQLILAQTTIYLACSPKSNSSYRAISKALDDVRQEKSVDVPKHLKTQAKGYKYPHDYPCGDPLIGNYVNQAYGAKNRYYTPGDAGQERSLKEFLQHLEQLKKQPEQK